MAGATDCRRWRRPSSACRHLLPYSDGEKGLAANLGGFLATPAIGEIARESAPPLIIREEDAGRQVRGSAAAYRR
ncbi:hypothetical protein MPLB_180042 [Mesorhizobium sp. ORS 3324]|nr:hypothetical protein MPLB_180042 [Mesorhizobium sp. ORS 3324]